MIGHPVARAWYQRHIVTPGRVSIGDPDVRRLLHSLAPTGPVRDLGGSTSLNLLLARDGLVLRIHRPFVSAARLQAERQLRLLLAGSGFRVGQPVGELMRCGPRWAELEHYLPAAGHDRDPLWLGGAIGELHSRLVHLDGFRAPRPLVTTAVTPRTLKHWYRGNRRAGFPYRGGPIDPLLVALDRQWVSPVNLPIQLVHADPRFDNIQLTADGRPAFFDFASSVRAPRVFDLAAALAFIALEQPDPDLGQMINHYERSAGTRLTGEEHAAMAPYAAAVLLCFEICGWGSGPFRSTAGAFLGVE